LLHGQEFEPAHYGIIKQKKEKGITMLEKKNYESLNCIDGDTDVCEEIEDYTGYICDVIAEVADSNVSIYNSNLWNNAPNIEGYIGDAISEGLVDLKNFDLMRLFQAGEYGYYTQLLYENLQTIIYNIAVNYINENYSNVKISEEDLEDALTGIDNNNTFDDITDAVDCLVEEIKEEEEEELI
jgi:hypothetical protein